jgi:hypothetical protein
MDIELNEKPTIKRVRIIDNESLDEYNNYSPYSSQSDDSNDSDYNPDEEIKTPSLNDADEYISSPFGKQKKLKNITEVPYQEPSEQEIKMLEGTKTPKALLEEEQNEEEIEKLKAIQMLDQKREYITMVKVVALVNCGKQPLSNPSTFYKEDKLRIMNEMET